MQLLTKPIRKKLPPIYTHDNTPKTEIPIVVKFFCPWNNWTWYAYEFDGEDQFFGFVDGFECELGYFSLSELESIEGPGGLRIERDRHWKDSTTLAEVMAESNRRRMWRG